MGQVTNTVAGELAKYRLDLVVVKDVRCNVTCKKDLSVRDFRLPPWCERDLRSSGILHSVDW
jgi:hypothetical protein